MSTEAAAKIVSVLRPLRTALYNREDLAEALEPFRNTLASAGALADAIESEEGTPRSWTNLLVESWAALNGWDTPEEEASALLKLLPESVVVGTALWWPVGPDVPALEFPLRSGEPALPELPELAKRLVSSGLENVVAQIVPTGVFRQLCHERGASTDGAPSVVRCRLAALLVSTALGAEAVASEHAGGPAPMPFGVLMVTKVSGKSSDGRFQGVEYQGCFSSSAAGLLGRYLSCQGALRHLMESIPAKDRRVVETVLSGPGFGDEDWDVDATIAAGEDLTALEQADTEFWYDTGGWGRPKLYALHPAGETMAQIPGRWRPLTEVAATTTDSDLAVVLELCGAKLRRFGEEIYFGAIRDFAVLQAYLSELGDPAA